MGFPSFAPPSPPLVSTWANRGAAGAAGTQIYILDAGENGALFVSDGIEFTHTGEIEILQRGKGWIVPSLLSANAATYSQSGNVITVSSLAHHIPDVSYNTKDVYLNMGTAATGATIPPGWFSDFQYVNNNTFTCVSSVSQTGTGAVNTNLAETFITDLTGTIKGGLLGLNGKTIFSYLLSNYTSANNKIVRFNFGSAILTDTVSTVQVTDHTDQSISNRNNESSQVYRESGLPTVSAINTSLDVSVSFSLQCAASSEFVAIHAASVYIKRS